MYATGGNTKIWGGVLERMREKDFGALPLQEGISPQWELSYSDVAPYYDKAEQLYQVHGRAGVDPTEPPRTSDFSAAPKPVEPFLQNCAVAWSATALSPMTCPSVGPTTKRPQW